MNPEDDIDRNSRFDEEDQTRATWGFPPWKLLLVVPFVALLWVPFYNSIEPALWGIPFFYWYQFLWVILTSVLIIWVHNRTG